jgi:PAS domain S-box-containing protein
MLKQRTKQVGILAGFGFALLILALIAVLSYTTSSAFIATSAKVSHTHAVIAQIASLHTQLLRAESEQRSFIITGDEAYLAPYKAAVQMADQEFLRLRTLVADNPAQQLRLDQMESLIKSRFQRLQEGAEIRRRQPLEAAADYIRRGSGKTLMESISTIFSEMNDEESRLLQRRSTDTDASARQTMMVTMVGSLIAFLLIAVAGFIVRRDLNKRHHAEAELRESEARYAGILNIADDAVISIGDNQRVTMFNQGAERIFGYQAAEVIGQSLDTLLPSRFTATHQHHIAEMAASSATSRKMGERRNIFGRRKDGSEFPAEASISKLELNRERIFTVMLRDITGRKQAENEINQLYANLEKRNAELELANKELESFSYSVSHDLRAPLRAIDGFSRILQEDYADKFDAEGNRVLNVIRSNTAKMSELINDLLEFSRLGRRSLDHSILSIADLAKSVFDDLRAANPERSLELRIKHLPHNHGDRAMLRQVLVNLLTNAVKFTRPRDVGQIEIGSRIENDQPVYYVRDNGVGFDMQYVNKLFGVFQRLHNNNEYEGTGVGLAIVQRIIHRHGGRVWAESEPGKGATFYFTLSKKEQEDGNNR